MDELVDLFTRVAEVERRLAGVVLHGPVSEVDPSSGTVRLRIGGTDDKPLLSPPVPYSQIAGGLKVHALPTVGQQMTMLSPSGDFGQGSAVPMTWSNDNASPSGAGDQNVITFGSVTLTLSGSGLVISVGGVTVAISAAGLVISGGEVKHDGKNIGSTHIHSGVEPGGATTAGPV